MSTGPSLDHAALLDVVRTAFGLDVTTLTFLPDGTAPAFRADGPFVRVFVKVMPPTTYGDQVTERALVELPLVRALRSSGTLPRVPEPLITLGGEPLAVLDGHRVFAYRWIDAVNTGKDWNAAAPERAVLLRRLHAGTAAIMSSTSALPMPPEDFALPFEPQLTESLHTLSCVPPDARPGLHALHELLLPHVDAILALLTRAQAYAARTRPRPRSFVVCHTDAHGGNVMRDAAGHLWIIDWETGRLAPPEHDLWMLHARLPEVLPAYREGLGAAFTPDLDVLAFYLCRRPLEDLAAAMGMLHEHTRPEQDEGSLRIVKEYVLPAVQRVEADLKRLASALGRAGSQGEHSG